MYTLYLDHMYPNSRPLLDLNASQQCTLITPNPLPAGILTDLADSILGRTCHITVAVMSL